MQSNFDKAAIFYDNSFTNTGIGKAQRNMVYYQLHEILSENKSSILEINCGTGEDAIWLADKGFQVTATDISNEMIAVAKTKSNTIHFAQADINTIAEQFSGSQFDVIFSNFGGLNCLTTQELHRFFLKCHEILSEKGQLVLVIMPKHTLWEKMYFILKGKFEEAFRRTKQVANANVDGVNVPTYYFNPNDVVQLSKDNFNFVSVNPIGFFIPPSYLEPFFKNRKRMLQFLVFLDSKIRNIQFLSKFADHYLIVIQKK